MLHAQSLNVLQTSTNTELFGLQSEGDSRPVLNRKGTLCTYLLSRFNTARTLGESGRRLP
eukprot:953527-Pleurochrysis_carterae.AAC.1